MIRDLDTNLLSAIQSRKPVSGLTHGFYHYPARFAPEIATSIIERFSNVGDWVLDPFTGGGTSVIEGLVQGRRVIGVDINALACFVSGVRTTPLSLGDEMILREWADLASELAIGDLEGLEPVRIPNLPKPVEQFIASALEIAQNLNFPRQRAFARCALLRLGQWALDCRDFVAPRRQRLGRQLPVLVRSMLRGLREFTAQCSSAGIPKNRITRSRILLHQSAATIHVNDSVRSLDVPPKLVMTSPPYPGVHVLYHRWQYFGRKETPAPYWIANVPDGCGASYYTCGSRSPTGLSNYFASVTAAFHSIRQVIAPDALIVQLVGFSDSEAQLPKYLAAMEDAGLKECRLSNRDQRLGRRVPNRKWYAKLRGDIDASSEVLLFHRIR